MSYLALIIALKGSSTSGNWGHSGRPGKHGGSAPGGGHGKLTGMRVNASKTDKLISVMAHRAERNAKPKLTKSPDTSVGGLESLLGDSLIITDDSAYTKQALKDLGLIPDKYLQSMAKKGVVISVSGEKPIIELDDMQSLKDVQPRGWPPGSTWNSVGGVYKPSCKCVVATGNGKSGSESTILHEFGHAIMDVKMTNKHFKRLFPIHEKIYDKLPTYLKQGGPGGRAGVEELWAEGFASTLKNRSQAVANYGQDFVDLVDEVLG